MTNRNYSNSDELERRLGEPVTVSTTTSTTQPLHGGSGQGGSGSTVQQAKDKVEQKAGQLAHQAEQQAGPLMDQAKQQAGQLADQAKQQATSQLSSQKQRATQSLGSVSQALRQTGQHLREQDQGTIAQYTDKAAEQVERVSGFLKNKNVSELMSEAERFARQQPSLFLGGAFALGVLGARFLKSSSEHSQGSSSTTTSRHTTIQAGTYPSRMEER